MHVETVPPRWPAGFATEERDRDALLVLMSLSGLKPARLLEAAGRLGTATACLDAVREGQLGSEGDRSFAMRIESSNVRRSLDACGARFVSAAEDEYPPQLNELEDPPAGLFVRGRRLPSRVGTVAVVGARRCTDLGRELGRAIGRDLATFGACVVSGAARGIDASAHEGALEAGGWTLAVLGSGIDVPHPQASRRLLDAISASGTIASEYPPGVPAEAFRFPARNRLIAGVASALVVVEGAERSGSLISARHALSIGREVFAVPGAVTNPLSTVPNTLIREGATLIRDADDLLGDLHLAGSDGRAPIPLDLSLAERAALDAIAGPVLPERIAREIGVGIPDAIALLLTLEIRGLVRCVGGRYERRLAAGRIGPG
jgi:DNA processing protein